MIKSKKDKQSSRFVHLHVHSEFSMLDGAAKITDIIDKAVSLNMDTVAITDHGNLHAAAEFVHYAKIKGIKPIIGIEAYLTKGKHTERIRDMPLYHLVLLAKNQAGYKNLIKLSSLGYLKGFFYRPRIDLQQLEEHCDGLICLSACISGEVPSKLLANDKAGAISAIKNYQRIFGKENFFIEIQNHGLTEQTKILKQLVEIANQCEAPIVATNDCHYINSEDWITQDLLMCVRTKSQLANKFRFRFTAKEFYMKSARKMETIFREYPEAIANTAKISEMCSESLEIEPPNTHSINLTHSAALDDELVTQWAPYYSLLDVLKKQAKLYCFPIALKGKNTSGKTLCQILERNVHGAQHLKQGLLKLPPMDAGKALEISIKTDKAGKLLLPLYILTNYDSQNTASMIKMKRLRARSSILAATRILGCKTDHAKQLIERLQLNKNSSLNKMFQHTRKHNDVVCDFSVTEKRILNIALKVEGYCIGSSSNTSQIVFSWEKLFDIVPLVFYQCSNDLICQYEERWLKDFPVLILNFAT